MGKLDYMWNFFRFLIKNDYLFVYFLVKIFNRVFSFIIKGGFRRMLLVFFFIFNEMFVNFIWVFC